MSSLGDRNTLLRLIGVAAVDGLDHRNLLIQDDEGCLRDVRLGDAPEWVRRMQTGQSELFLHGTSHSPTGLILSDGVFLMVTGLALRAPSPWIGPLMRQLVENAPIQSSQVAAKPLEIDLGQSMTLYLRDGRHACLADTQIRKGVAWQKYSERDFANSAHYMGTKRQLIPLIMGALDMWSPQSATLVDLMTGSGVVAGAFARVGPTWASDAQQFALHLARAQGGGCSRAVGAALLDYLRPRIDAYRSELADRIGEALSVEEAIFGQTSDLAELAAAYADFVRRFPTFPDEGGFGCWKPSEEVAFARTHPDRSGCLITAFYANIFFGVRQAIDLDSIRRALFDIEDAELRNFAIGALVTTASEVATTYGAHFAQPYAPPTRLASPVVLRRALEYRMRSVIAEFEVRLLALASESETAAVPVRTVDGPWERALANLDIQGVLREATVYVDPPYTRDEYSRYYHVLESLVRYDYPQVSGRGKVPVKGTARFSSEFHTRSRAKRIICLQKLLAGVLSTGATCIWSHSTALDVPLEAVVRGLPVASCATVGSIYNFKKQGRVVQAASDHQEVLVLLRPS